MHISVQQAKQMMEQGRATLILDVREQEEFDGGHVPNAVLFPVGKIDEASAAEMIPEKDSTVLVYCHSGRRSSSAAYLLARMGYTNVYDFGGILDWPYEIEYTSLYGGKS